MRTFGLFIKYEIISFSIILLNLLFKKLATAENQQRRGAFQHPIIKTSSTLPGTEESSAMQLIFKHLLRHSLVTVFITVSSVSYDG